MSIVDDINVALRDHVRIASAHPAPVGDPESGVHEPQKADLRGILIGVVQALGNPDALDIILRNSMRTDNTSSPSGRTYPLGTKVVLTHDASGAVRFWKGRGILPVGTGTDGLVRDADGFWWELLQLAGLPELVAQVLGLEGRVVSQQSVLDAVSDSVAAQEAKVAEITESEPTFEGDLPLIRIEDEQGNFEDVLRLTPEGVDLVLAPRVLEAAASEINPATLAGEVDSSGETSLLEVRTPDESEPYGTVLGLADDGLTMRVAGVTVDRWATTNLSDDKVFTAQAGMRAVDRFVSRSGTQFPTTQIGGAARKAILISTFGQSNGDVTNMDDPLVREKPGMPYHVLTLSDHRPTSEGTTRGLHVGWQGVRRQITPTGLIPVREGEMAGNRAVQSYSVAAAVVQNLLSEHDYRVFSVRSSAWGGQGIYGNNPTEGLWKDSNGDFSTAWLNWTDDLRSAYDLLLEAGYEIEAIHIHFTHQEKDWQDTRDSYRTNLLDMIDAREALLDAEFPGTPYTWFVDQASGSSYRNGKYEGNRWPVRMAIVDVANARENVHMVMPRYHMSFGLNGGIVEDIHHSNRARVMQGETYAHAKLAMERGEGWACPIMSAATVQGNDVIVDFESLRPLVIDESFCPVRSVEKGFRVDNGAIAITEVKQTGPRQITVSCASDPTGTTIGYAYRTQDTQDSDEWVANGRVSLGWPIGTGAVRDAWEYPSQYMPGERILRPALGYELPL